MWRPGWSRFTWNTWNWTSLILVGNKMEVGERGRKNGLNCVCYNSRVPHGHKTLRCLAPLEKGMTALRNTLFKAPHCMCKLTALLEFSIIHLVIRLLKVLRPIGLFLFSGHPDILPWNGFFEGWPPLRRNRELIFHNCSFRLSFQECIVAECRFCL